MKWTNESAQNPGKSVWWAKVGSHLYVAQKKRGSSGIWRLAFRATDGERLRIINTGGTLSELKEYAEIFEERIASEHEDIV
ncbi:hypothetical protein J4U01_gp009 [Mycobacterium phage Kumao]|uniref:Uncharacterized protein n=1 Tax=Mycobacterium phage Kumao TaxID=2041344 RepID=A0A2D1GPK2_9CAUD|nr:hypothetical protein J4U01_gp009 [Mycobacterium phage Kumao]ATN93972.1 hypothetical protein SEA_KUMAO_9 [Mycobacterium phage Kumao]